MSVLARDVLREYVRRQVEDSGLSQVQYARALGASTAAINMILNGHRGVTSEYLDGIAVVRGVQLSVILREVAMLAFELETAAPPPAQTVPAGKGIARAGVARVPTERPANRPRSNSPTGTQPETPPPAPTTTPRRPR